MLRADDHGSPRSRRDDNPLALAWWLLRLCFFAYCSPLTSKAQLKVGDRAPDFALQDQKGQTIKLSDYLGKKSVVLAFYIRASTPG